MTRTRSTLLVLALAGALTGQARAATPAVASPTKGVVLVTTNLAFENASAAGTGIVMTAGGEILTNNHVIRGATTINVVMPASHKSYSASVVGYDVVDDIALLQVSGAPKLATATRADSAKLAIGQFARAVGNANGGGVLVQTTGKVTALHQTITVSDDQGGSARLANLIRTSARLVPGDSGGPLLDAKNRVIGVDAAGSSSAAGAGYAIPINQAYALVRQMETGSASTLVHIGKTAFLGISISTTNGGLTIANIIPGTAAATAGLVVGDAITSIDGTPVSALETVRTILFRHHPGDAVTVGYTDTVGNQTQTTLTLGDGPPQ